MPPNPLRPFQQAATHVDSAAREVIERVLSMTTLDEHAMDMTRSVASIDDLTAHLEVVTERVERIDRNMEQLVPLLERLVVSSEALHEDLAPISSLASKIPGSGARRRRRARRLALEAGSGVMADGGASGAAGIRGTTAPRAIAAPPTEDDLPPAPTGDDAEPPTP
ncbi:MAG: hypothetical protein WC558_11970 [Patulibacter sp.]